MRPFLFASLLFIAMSSHADTLVYFGSYAQGEGAGIYVARFDSRAGRLSPPTIAAPMAQPGFLVFDAKGSHLYAVGERAEGIVRGFSIDRADGRLSPLGRATSGGPGPCHISMHPDGVHLFASNYSDGSVGVVRIHSDGSLAATDRAAYFGSSVHPQRQTKSYAHSATPSSNGRFLVVADLGADRLVIHRFDPQSGTLTESDPPFARVAPGSGPRHFAFHPDGRRAYVVNELSNTVTVFDWDADLGTLGERQTISTLPSDYAQPSTSAEVAVHPSGRFLYTSNRGHDSIAVFAIDGTNGTLEARGHRSVLGQTPRHFALSPDGRWMIVANQGSNQVRTFSVDTNDGDLEPHGEPFTVPVPTCVRFLRLD
ncbi:hypothetical protein ASA1KI_38590 [Opitutales bacterium ASA1]|uniref:lactonase family protein n=1 Tax=Congregicoccus parvus TaxID=3081749 RepID=UPI002B2A9153|nr:hypothetical protein ASA1KI_38590 [Opitutales bacterium ASA1]